MATRDRPEWIAVYGTLLPGGSAWHLLEPLVAESGGTISLPGTLYDTGSGYPALVLDDRARAEGKANGSGSVPAQLFRLADPVASIPVLDRYEGPEYSRLRLEVADHPACWVYEWTESVAGMRPLPGGWLN